MPQWGGGGDKCPRCQKTVYTAEKLLACSAAWHKGCFKCKTCKFISL
jgi:cysteine/glycine-rich protein